MSGWTERDDRFGIGDSAEHQAVIAVPGNWHFRYVKHGLDAILALLLLIPALPIMFVAMVAVRATSRGSCLYKQRRVGRHGKEFTIYKIRSMYEHCEARTGAVWSNPDHDPRVTKVGWYLRRLHIDELPQLWNVLRGEMSLVGPRPERPEIIEQLEKAIPHYRQRLLVRPGMTGLSQVQLPPDTDLASVRRKLAHDLFYIKHLGMRMDFKVMLGTVVYLLGIPASVAHRFFRVPGGAHVERAYERLVEQASKAHVQPI
jgi:lipopolysaccharide/colanic/teichoic acid biosynthesis glycosyltransferase